jgi:hypothetical protein
MIAGKSPFFKGGFRGISLSGETFKSPLPPFLKRGELFKYTPYYKRTDIIDPTMKM